MTTVRTIEELEAIYGQPGETSIVKEVGAITPSYAKLIEASPFMALATAGPEGLDCSPRGEAPNVVRIHDGKTLMMPDRRGNNRVDSLRNIIQDPRVALLFLIPGSGTTLRVNGRAEISVDPDLLASFAVEGQLPRSVVIIRVETVYFQCARAIVRSNLWKPENYPDKDALPTPGQILAEISKGNVGGESYDREWPERAVRSLW
ncbi:MAG TPA: pyridoxamine 5'-phosphate oxidase family protein [Hyphomicrobiales bacterium]|nr:pyridoxamine 5'-phosphate oxidase family protein [Hyphomicrobiales bacterium]